MAAVLGVSAYYHDAAAALVVDGKLIAAIQEERLSRSKHDAALPLRAARACLAYAGLPASALQRVVFYENPFAKLERVIVDRLRAVPRGLRGFGRALASQLGHKLWVLDQLAAALGVERSRVEHVDHHASHAASAYYATTFQDAAVLTLDGVGERVSTALWHGRGDALRCLLTQELPDSLGLLYAGLTAWLGFAVNSDEYKVMGLAAYGTPRHRDLLERVARIDPDGSLRVEPRYFDDFLDPDRAYGSALVDLLGPARAAGRPWSLASAPAWARAAGVDEPPTGVTADHSAAHARDDQRYADVAASLQAFTEDAVLALCRRARAETHSTRLCLAGGVAHNARLIGRLARESGFAELFVQPAAGDAGGALGAAWLGALRAGDRIERGLPGADLGVPCDPARGAALADALGLRHRVLSDPVQTLAEQLGRGAVVGVMSGRCEWGPRALGQRSFLALPSSPAIAARINREIKQREPFRPLAPAVLASAAGTWFEPVPEPLARFMTATTAVHEARREAIAGVVHVDGSARVQHVASDASGGSALLAATLQAVGREQGIPMLLNTSLNVAGEPIASGAADGLDALVQSGADALLIEDLWIEGRAR
jgi:carbamoyltransferase